jgi:phosphatidylinositol kinase/protein kinase (PI-3  family)
MVKLVLEVKRKTKANHSFFNVENPQGPELLNSRAVAVVNRVSNKLTGRDFNPRVTLDVPTQVEKLIQQATSLENLCQCYVGWYVYYISLKKSYPNYIFFHLFRCAFW